MIRIGGGSPLDRNIHIIGEKMKIKFYSNMDEFEVLGDDLKIMTEAKEFSNIIIVGECIGEEHEDDYQECVDYLHNLFSEGLDAPIKWFKEIAPGVIMVETHEIPDHRLMLFQTMVHGFNLFYAEEFITRFEVKEDQSEDQE